jgi:hypothetical protein
MKLASPKESLFLLMSIGRFGWLIYKYFCCFSLLLFSGGFLFYADWFLLHFCQIWNVHKYWVLSVWSSLLQLTVSIFSWICSLSCVLSRKHFWKWDGFRWWSKDTVAVVTGANKGIGLEIVRQLAKEGITVVLTARDATRGKEALGSLKPRALQCEFPSSWCC